VPACELLIEKKRYNAFHRVNELEEDANSSLTIKKSRSVEIPA